MMLAVCSTSFGYFLIYNVSTTVKGADDDTGLKTTVPMKGYMILTLDDATDEITDANLILYGKDASTPKEKVYVQVDVEGTVEDIGDNIVFLGFEGNDPFDFSILVSGKLVSKNVGTSEDEELPPSLKGNIQVTGSVLLGPAGQEVWGTANASMTLWNAATKFVNGSNGEDTPWTLDQILSVSGNGEEPGLLGILEEKGYQAAQL